MGYFGPRNQARVRPPIGPPHDIDRRRYHPQWVPGGPPKGVGAWRWVLARGRTLASSMSAQGGLQRGSRGAQQAKGVVPAREGVALRLV